MVLLGCEFIVAGTFHVPSAGQKPLVFGATAHGVCLLLWGESINSQPIRAVILDTECRATLGGY